MKKYVMASLLCLILILAVGCAKQTGEAAGQTVAEAATEPVGEQVTGQVVADTVESEAELPAAEETLSAEEWEEGTSAKVDGDVVILGNKGFEPAEFAVNVNEAVVFVNQEPGMKDVALIFQLKGTTLTKSSGKIGYGETYTHTFDKAGTYVFWSVGHGVKGTIVVQ